MKKTQIGLFSTVFTLLMLLLASCHKNTEPDPGPMPGEGVTGDWVTLAGTNYYNIKFSNFYTYSITSVFAADVVEKGEYSVDTKKHTVSLTPDLDGTHSREWSYDNSKSDELVVTGLILYNDAKPSTVALSRYSSTAVKTVTVHSTATKSALTPEMLLGSPKIKLVGEINQDDFTVLRNCTPMTELDMSGVTIVGEIVIKTNEKGDEIVDGKAIPESAFGTSDDSDENITLRKIILPDDLEFIGRSAFSFCHIGGKLEIPSGVKVIKDMAFESCSFLTGVTFPSEMEDIFPYAFGFCTNLSGTITLPSGLADGVICLGLFRGCESLTEVILPDDIEVIGQYAFIGCKKMKKINMPASLEVVWPYAFTECSSLSGSLTFPEGTQGIGEYAFTGTGYDGTLTINKSMIRIERYAFADTEFSSIVMNWTEDDEPQIFAPQTWFPEQFMVGIGTKTIMIPKGQTEWYTNNLPADDYKGCKYNLEEEQ